MKLLNSFSVLIVVLMLLSNCSSAPKNQKKAPIILGDAYFQKWVSGIKDGDSGVDLFIPTKLKNAGDKQLDSVFFRGKATKLQVIEDKYLVYVGRFKSEINRKQDIIMSSDTHKEYGNQAPILTKKIPFDLKDSECVISYKDEGTTKYFRIENIIERPRQNYPIAAPTKQGK